MGTFSNSWTLISQCFTVLKKDKELLLFPLFSGIAVILLFASLLFPLLLSYTFLGQKAILLLILWYFLISFVILFFNTALIACAKYRFEGNNPTLRYGITFALSRLPNILLWSIISATIGLILRALSNSNRNNLLGRIVIALLGMAWSLITYFVIPILAFENTGIIQAIKKSATLFKKTWGENVVAAFSIGIGFLGIFILLLILSVLAVLLGVPQLLLFFLLCFVLLIILVNTLHGIFVAALYLYATTGKISSDFEPSLIKKAFL